MDNVWNPKPPSQPESRQAGFQDLTRVNDVRARLPDRSQALAAQPRPDQWHAQFGNIDVRDPMDAIGPRGVKLFPVREPARADPDGRRRQPVAPLAIDDRRSPRVR